MPESHPLSSDCPGCGLPSVFLFSRACHIGLWWPPTRGQGSARGSRAQVRKGDDFMSNSSSIAPSHMADFQTAVGAVLVQLYNGWPEPISIDRAAVARTLVRTEDPSTAAPP